MPRWYAPAATCHLQHLQGSAQAWCWQPLQVTCTTHTHTHCCQLQVAASSKGLAAGWSGSMTMDCIATSSTMLSCSRSAASAAAAGSRQQAAVASSDAGSSSSKPGSLDSTAATAPEHSTSMGASMGASKTWLLPRQTGDREAGGALQLLAELTCCHLLPTWLQHTWMM